jgi:hypothetical protein
MFGKKKQPTTPVSSSVGVTSIPSEFYGGTNPVIKFKEVKKEMEYASAHTEVSPADKKLHDEQTASGRGKVGHPVNLLSNRRFVILTGVVIFIILTSIISLYYFWPYLFKAAPLPSLPLPIQPTSTIVTPISSTVVIIPSTSTPTSTVPLRSAQLEFPSILLSDSIDGDGDGLSDREEEDAFNTDPGVPDTDSDGYQDGHEVYYLYNPSGKEPEKLADSGLVKDYENPLWHYRIYYPAKWALGNIDNDYRDILWSTLTGENIELQVIDKKPDQKFEDWLIDAAPHEKLADLTNFESYFKFKGHSRSDYLVYYFPANDKVYVLIYHAAPDTTSVNYRAVIKMMARSFRLPLEESANTTIPIEGASTSIGIPPTISTTTTSTTSPSLTPASSSISSSSTVPLPTLISSSTTRTSTNTVPSPSSTITTSTIITSTTTTSTTVTTTHRL